MLDTLCLPWRKFSAASPLTSSASRHHGLSSSNAGMQTAPSAHPPRHAVKRASVGRYIPQIHFKTLCPSGLRGWTQVPLARAAWVQIPQVSFSNFAVAQAVPKRHRAHARRTACTDYNNFIRASIALQNNSHSEMDLDPCANNSKPFEKWLRPRWASVWIPRWPNELHYAVHRNTVIDFDVSLEACHFQSRKVWF